MFAFLWWWYGATTELAVISFYWCLLAVILVIDLEHKLILNKVVYPAIVIALIIDVFTPEPGIVSGAVGGGVGLGIMLCVALLFQGGMGWGDVKMAALIGAMVGFPEVLLALSLAMVGGGLVAALLLALKIRKRKESIAFGPFLSLGTMASLLWGHDFITWYLGLF